MVLSDEQPFKTRWAFQVFFLYGKMMKTEHTLGTAVIFSAEMDEEPFEKVATLFSFEAASDRNSPKYLYFFSLHQYAVLHELKQQPVPSLPS